jgi:uncharacterized protein YbjT (DUF2867 family)
LTALIIGASGLVGTALLQKILANKYYDTVTSVGRKKIDIHHPKLKQIVCELKDLKNHTVELKANDYFCCLGTTIKIAKSQDNFKKVDYEAPLTLAQIAKQHNADGFYVVSAMGASTDSSVFYNQVKGQLEHDLKALNLKSLHIFQPSLLLGARKEFRLGEKIFENIKYLPIWFGALKKYQPIAAEAVAEAMIQSARKKSPGTHIVTSDQMQPS